MIEDSLYRLTKVVKALKSEMRILDDQDFDISDLQYITRRLDDVIDDLELDDKVREEELKQKEQEKEKEENGDTEEEL